MTEAEKDSTPPGGRNRDAGRDRRSKPRRRSRGRAFAQFVVRPSLRCFRVAVCEASPQGLSFLHDGLLEPGTVLAVQLAAGMRGASLIRSAVVVNATRHRGKWRIGCRVSPPSARGAGETVAQARSRRRRQFTFPTSSGPSSRNSYGMM
jgi:hypothetical protein